MWASYESVAGTVVVVGTGEPHASNIRKRFDTPRRPSGSQESERSESVTAPRIFLEIVSGASVIRIRELGFGADLDIF